MAKEIKENSEEVEKANTNSKEQIETIIILDSDDEQEFLNEKLKQQQGDVESSNGITSSINQNSREFSDKENDDRNRIIEILVQTATCPEPDIPTSTMNSITRRLEDALKYHQTKMKSHYKKKERFQQALEYHRKRMKMQEEKIRKGFNKNKKKFQRSKQPQKSNQTELNEKESKRTILENNTSRLSKSSTKIVKFETAKFVKLESTPTSEQTELEGLKEYCSPISWDWL